MVPYQANDPLFLNGSQWFLKKVQADYAWLITKGSSDVVVAIVDTGADLGHPDLAANLWVNVGEIPGNGIDDDGNGFIDDINGWDFAGACQSVNPDGSCNCGPRATPTDVDGHGTHVAGIVAGVQNDFIGGSGVAPGVKIMILRVSDCIDGSIYASAVVAAYDYALRMGAHVVQCSFGMSYPNYFSPQTAAPWYSAGQNAVYSSAIAPMQQKGMLVVAAAGNEYLDLDQLAVLGYPYNPCLVNLSNVVCVACSDTNDQLTNFSNWGTQTVHLAAPGTAIMSTMKGNTYATLTGTSMAAPVVSGTAALLLYILGATTGNYYQAAQVKSLLLGAGDRVPGLQVQSGSRVNAFNSSKAALLLAAAPTVAGVGSTYAASEGLVLVQPSLPASALLPVSTRGFEDTYFTLQPSTWGQQLRKVPASLVLDVSCRSLTDPYLTGFKYGSGAAVALTALLQLNVSGLYNIQILVQPAHPSTPTLLFINGTRVGLSASGGGAFQVAKLGYFSFELQLPLPVTSVQLSIKSPTGNAYLVPSASFLSTPGQALTASGSPAGIVPPTSTSSFYPPGLKLFSGWQVSYNLTSVLPSLIWPAAAPTSLFGFTTMVPDLNFTAASSLASALLPADSSSSALASTAAVLGVASTRLRTQGVATSFVISAACTRCMVWVEGLLALDRWEVASQPSVTPPKPSPCVTVPAGALPPALTVAFSATTLYSTYLTVAWQPCPGSTANATLPPLAQRIATSALWQPDDNLSGRVPGLQCDIWQSGAIPAPPSPYQPIPLGGAASGSPTFKQRLTSGSWSLALQDLVPSIQARFSPRAVPPQLFSARCWTYLNLSSVPTANLSVALPPSTAYAQPSAVVQLAGRQAWPPPKGGALLPAALPNLLMPGEWNALLVVEWQNLSDDMQLTVTSAGGSGAGTAAAPLAIGGPANAMLLPLLVQGVQPFLPPSTSVPSVGPAGHLSRTYLADRGLDVSQAVQYDSSSLQLAGSYSSPSVGLDGLFQYNAALGAQLRYTHADGYFAAAADGVQEYLFRLDDDVVTATSLVMAPGVLVLPARLYTIENMQAVVVANVTLPSGYIYTEAIAKTSRPDGKTSFYVDVLLPFDLQAHANGPVDNSVWFPHGLLCTALRVPHTCCVPPSLYRKSGLPTVTVPYSVARIELSPRVLHALVTYQTPNQ